VASLVRILALDADLWRKPDAWYPLGLAENDLKRLQADPAQAGRSDQDGPSDAINLAKRHRAGELTPVWIPDLAHEAMRDLVRARLAAVRSLPQARQQLSGFLLRHGFHYNRPPGRRCIAAGWLATIRSARPPHRNICDTE
jgi:transposase